MAQVTIRWNTRDEQIIRRIRERFAIPGYVTLNGWSPAVVAPSDREVFDECARRGFFSILQDVKWCKNGDVFSFKIRLQ